MVSSLIASETGGGHLLVTILVMYLGYELAKQLLMSAPDLGSALQPIWQQRPGPALKWGPTKLTSAY